METAGDKLKQTFVRYKELLERGIVRDEIGDVAYQGTTIDIQMMDPKCNTDCVQICFTDHVYRFENVLDTEKYCLIPHCNCYTGQVWYSDYIETDG